MKIKTKNCKAFGKALRSLRIQKGLTQEALAFDANLDRTYISMLEVGGNSPTLETMLTLCSAMGVTFLNLAQRFEEELTHRDDSHDE